MQAIQIQLFNKIKFGKIKKKNNKINFKIRLILKPKLKRT